MMIVIMMNVINLNVTMLSIVMLRVIYAECHNADVCFAKYHLR
jgi:hypothetical protein